ncbi:toxin CcdB [Sphingomonas insulae]|uniref:Toxin CcdB n=1 Tax=Sphingomonas insulae TaxID=424800 RepID=A0ABN1HLZ2_9SPHN|nr:CcdB family protein [Sphingomonas insulae]NIJ30207.1 toxin CcdB [Sphingomonas insulae]
MAQFDALRVTGNVIVLDCQSNFLADLPTRFVVPLRKLDHIDLARLTPTFIVGGEPLTMITPLARSIAKRDILGTVQSLAEHEYEIKAAIDLLVTGF